MAEPAPGGQALLQHVAGLAGDWPGKGAGDHGPGQREVGLVGRQQQGDDRHQAGLGHAILVQG